MSFKVTLSQLNDENVVLAMLKLQGVKENRIMSIKTKYNVSRIAEKLQKEKVRLNEIRSTTMEGFLERDADGKKVNHVDTEGKVHENFFVIKKDRTEEWAKVEKELLSTEAEINCHPIKISDISEVDLSATEIAALMFMLTGFEDLEDKADPADAPIPIKGKKDGTEKEKMM